MVDGVAAEAAAFTDGQRLFSSNPDNANSVRDAPSTFMPLTGLFVARAAVALLRNIDIPQKPSLEAVSP